MTDPKVQELINSRNIGESHHSLLEAWPDFQEACVKGVINGVVLGYIPKSAEARLDDALRKTSVRVTDSVVLDTYGSMIAYYDSDSDEIGVSHDIRQIGEGPQEHLTHEFTHKISGGTFKAPEADSAEFHRSRVGFSTEFKSKVLNRTGLNEAVTQHVTLGILTGDFETIDPDKRADKNNIYYEYRKVFAEFIERSGGVIGVKTVTNAYFEDTGPDGGTQWRRKLVQEVVRAYGPGALNKLNKLMDLTDMVDISRFDEVIFSRIQPVELDEQGRIIKQGFIDTENLPTLYDLYTKPEDGQGIVYGNDSELVTGSD